jgi:endonuclease-8
MRMNGSWHIYRAGERWRRPRTAMRIVLTTDEYVAVGFDIPVAEFLTARDLRRHPGLNRLGPDLLSAGFDEATALARFRLAGNRPVGDVLLDQRVMAGVGNVFKCEVLFVSGVEPFRPVSAITDEEARTLIGVARDLLGANVVEHGSRGALRAHRRTTRFMNPAASLWVYGRGGKPCRRCGTPIECRKQGESARLTYWCPKCQR